MALERITRLPDPPERPADAHKGTFGKVLIIGGSPGMSGAAALAGLGALRGGAGLVHVAVPAPIVPIIAGIEPSYLTVPLSSDRSGYLSDAAMGEVWAAVDGKDACGLGPGLGRHGISDLIVTSLFQEVETPLVVDADALNALAEDNELLDRHIGPRILTPHPGEFARLLGTSISDVQAHRVEFAANFAAQHRLVLVLKGKETVVTDGRQIYLNTTGNNGMATGGTGDVLTGITTALLAQRMSPFNAAQLAVFLHGRAGDLAAAELSEPGMIASDLPRYLGNAWRSLNPSSSSGSPLP